MMSIRVILADDHILVRQGVRALLEREGILVVGEATDGQEAQRLVQREDPDAAVMDISMPKFNGLDAALSLSRTNPRTRLILLTRHNEQEYVAEALRCGVRGYVLKDQAASDLVRAIREVCNGQVYLSPGVSRAVVEAYANPDQPKNTLSARERQVLQLIAEGKTTRDIAALIHVSAKTVETHRARLMQKLGIHEIAGLVRYAIRKGLVQP
ncbi:MAG TPA: response regulator transcription factor [Steroidobacteraceae bacterium]|nr:response regulator transcription factor [Steroidobacteraceae bacterium]